MTINILDVDEIPPEIKGFSGEAGDASSSISMDENLSSVGTFTANESVTWSISGGVDKDQFSIDESTGALTFKKAPDYETPLDSDQDNSYEVTVSATDAANNVSSQEVTINILDVEHFQKVFASKNEINYFEGKEIEFDISYTTSNQKNSLTGLGLRVHYDSSVLTPSGETNGFSALIDTFGDPAIIDDNNNFDNDTSTDKYISISWVDFYSNFPGEELPSKVGKLSFATSSDNFDSITGEPIPTSVNFTAGVTSEGYDFLGESVSLIPTTFTLDVDGSGRVSALGDGLMVIRKLLGPSFAGEKLTANALTSSATRNTDEIHEYIQLGSDLGVLDVDGDGKVSALGDGLMIIRKLLGPSFAGEKLTANALTNSATRNTDEIHEYIESLSEVSSFL